MIKAFKPNDISYLLYYYQVDCHDCQIVKDEIIDFAINNYHPIYFIKISTPHTHKYDVSNIDLTIGKNKADEVWVGVTPQIATIENHVVVNNKYGVIDVEYILSTYKK